MPDLADDVEVRPPSGQQRVARKPGAARSGAGSNGRWQASTTSSVGTQPDGAVSTRLERQTQEERELETRQPLRRGILDALVDKPATPTVLAALLEARPESISRQLRSLLDAGLVRARPVFGDGRGREYVVTQEGERQLIMHRAFGARETRPSKPPESQIVGYLSAALESSVSLRRKQNRLDEAVANLQEIAERAGRAGAHGLALEATAELATTLRQALRLSELDDVLGALESISLGQDPRFDATHALPAAAHLHYALGRLSRGGGDNPVVRMRNMWTAARLYEQLREAGDTDQSSDWRRRCAWSLVGIARAQRQSSELEDALTSTRRALAVFQDLDDPYGTSYCYFTFGFYRRLLGDFEDSWRDLQAAHKLAVQHGFERFQADALTQMGEVRRCLGDTSDARELLGDSIRCSERLRMTVTAAFAYSSLGAVDYQEGRLPEAQAAFKRAHRLFKTCRHQEGLALNARRQAVVARRVEPHQKTGGSELLALTQARHQYRILASPAGVVACEIEYGRLHLLGRRDTDWVVPQLTERLVDSPFTAILELDPWVPSALAAFADDTGDRALIHRAHRLLEMAKARIARRIAPEKAVSDALERLATFNTSTVYRNEMAGEPRAAPHDLDVTAVLRATSKSPRSQAVGSDR